VGSGSGIQTGVQVESQERVPVPLTHGYGGVDMELGLAAMPDDDAPDCVEELPVGRRGAVVKLDLLGLGVADMVPAPVPVGLPLAVLGDEVEFATG
jgi:hypothetical protein